MADISSVKLQDNQIYYFKDNSAIVSISRSGNTYTATRHDGTTFEFTQKDDNTTYTFEDGVNSFIVTPSNGTAQTVTVTPSIPNATQSSDGLMSATDKTKLDGVANGAEVNQNAFSNIKVGSTTLAADSKTDTLEFVAGDNITLTPTEVSDKITISSSYTNTTYTLTQDATDGHKFSLEGTDGYFKEITIPDANTTYTIEADTTNNKIKLIPSSGSAVSITVPFATNATNATNATKATGDESGNNIKNTYAASFSISDHTITLKNKNGTSLGTVTVPDNNTTYSFATGDSNGQIKVTPSGGSAQNISVKGLGTAAFKNTTDTYSSSGTDPVTGKAVASALETLPTPMVFKGTLGTGGTISQLPTASASTVGNTYRVITNGTYAGQVAKDGDEFIGAELSSGVYSWVYIPSADEPSGTVTSVGITNGGGLSVSGSPITTSGTITISHADTSSQASVDNSGRTYIQDISLDTYGHVTKITSATETVVNTDRYVNSASFAYDSTNDNVKMTLTRAGSDTATVPANIPKVSSSSAGVVPKGAAVSSQSQSTKFLREDGTWAAPSYTTNTNTTYTIGTSGNTVTLTPSSGSVQSITVPFATNATNATKATQDANGDVIATTYRKLSNNDFDTINATEINAGDLIVTGVGRFTNGLYGDLSGTATKVSNSLKIQLNGGTTEGTNQFTYDGSAAKTVNVTKSAIGLGNVDNTADANKSVASANTAGSATKATQDESGNNIKATYAASFSISDHTITLKNKNGVSLGTVTVPDNNDNTWRKVQVNGTDILGTATNTNPLNLKAGTNVSLSNSSGTVTIASTDTNTTYSLSASGESVVLSGSDNSSSTADLSSAFAKYTPYKGNMNTAIGQNTPAAATKTYWESNTNIPTISVNTAYNSSGTEYTLLFSKGSTNNYGSILRWGYSTPYLEILRRFQGNWQSTDWEKISAGYADTAGSATKATQDGSGNVITSTYLPLAGGTVTGMTTFNKTIHSDGGQHLYGGGATNSMWYKITLATNGLTPPSSQQWYMCSLSLDIGGDYNSGAKGRIELSYYIHWSGSAFAATNVYGFASGANMGNVEVYYKLTEPFIIYVKTLNQYSSLWVRNVTYRDSAYTFRTLETKVETSSAITVENYTAIPISRLYTSNGTYLTTNSSLVPQTNNELYLGSSNSKWSYVYATKFIGALQGNADTASKLGSSNVGSATQPIYLASGTATACTYTLGKSVPSDAVFTDHYASTHITGKPSTFTPSSHTHPVSDLTWGSGVNLVPTATANGQEWSIDLTPGSYTGTYWQIWSAKNSKTIFACYPDDNSVAVPSGKLRLGKQLTVGGTIAVSSANYGNWNEGIRINKCSNNIAALVLGGDANSESGTADNVYFIGTYNNRKLYISHNGAQDGTTYFYADSSTQKSPSLQIGSDLRVNGISYLGAGNNGTKGGISLYDGTAPTTYGIAMRTTTNSGKHGAVQGDWAIYSYMNDQDNRGWILKRDGVGGVASVDTTGNAVFNGYVGIGGNTTNTSGVRQVYNSTTKSLDFVFVA